MATIFSLPTEIIDTITRADNIGLSTQFSLRLVCAAMNRVVKRPRVQDRQRVAEHPNNQLEPDNQRESSKVKLPLDVCGAAAKDGHLDILIWAVSSGSNPPANTMKLAAGGGHLDIIKYLRELGHKWSSNIIKSASRNGHLDVIKYAIADGCSYYPHVFLKAAINGHLHILQFLHENAIICYTDRCDSRTNYGMPREHKIFCVFAAKTGQIHILEWAQSIGVPEWEIDARRGAYLAHNFDVLNWLLESRVEMHSGWYIAPIENGWIDILDWLYEKKCPGWDFIRVYAISCGKTSVVKWCDSKGI